MIKKIAITLNVVLLCAITFLVLTEDNLNKEGLIFGFLGFTAPAFSLATFRNNVKENAGLVSLFIERLRLQEQCKIDKLKAQLKA